MFVIELKSILKKPEMPLEQAVPKLLEIHSLEDRVYEIYGRAVGAALYFVCSRLGAYAFSHVSFDPEEEIIVVPSRGEILESGVFFALYNFPVINKIKDLPKTERSQARRDILEVRRELKSGQKWLAEEMR